MVTISLTIEGVEGGSFGTITSSFDLSEDDGDRLLAHVVARYGVTPRGEARTPQEATDAFSEALIRRFFGDVRRGEIERAAAEAAQDAGAVIEYQKSRQ